MVSPCLGTPGQALVRVSPRSYGRSNLTPGLNRGASGAASSQERSSRTSPHGFPPRLRIFTLSSPSATGYRPGSEWIFSKWSYNFSPSTGHIYQAMDYHYHIHHRRRRSRQRSNLFYNNHADCTPSLPTDCIPVEELASPPSILDFRGLRIRRQSRPPTTCPTSFFEYLSSLPSWDRRLLQHVEILDGDALADYFSTDGSLFIVSDGGAANERGSYGTVLATSDDILVQVSGTTEGTLPGSFRAESYGC
jgi:hypothetical protein